MADGQTDLDKLVGTEPADVVPWENKGAKWRPDGVAVEDKLPIKAMPMKQKAPPFKITGGGNGG